MDADEATGLTNAAALVDVAQDRGGFRLGQVRPIQGGALALGEAGLAGAAVQEAVLPLPPVAIADGQVPATPDAMVLASGVLAAEPGQVVHGVISPRSHRL